MIIKLPRPETKVVASVSFVKGVGETDNEWLISWFRSHGYMVEDANTERVETPSPAPVQDLGINFDAMSIEDLKEYAKAIGRGRGIGILKTKEQLIHHITKE